ncbi:S-layer homology domain-containing protein [Paenibacillus pasadenensis]|uniref:S-layer homology domain-containing protein n=1 Tax=Paenibacillus pasadenensis TaxID=217090 RepID=UPI00203AFFF2|nr:S-layer homology domain-containing protein [Paenibacillus pasadenensis]MCM3749944.1 S-layer homology domain-containing protein [Paenibacillus pasadenensis]
MKSTSTRKAAAAAVLVLTGLLAAACDSSDGKKTEPQQSVLPSSSPAVSPSPGGGLNEGTEEPQPSPATVAVSDISKHKFRNEIVKLLESGAAAPDADGRFRPAEPVTRGEFIRWMSAYDNKGIAADNPGTPTFSDLAPGSEDYELIEGLAKAEAIAGLEDGTIRLGDNLTRGQLTLLWAWYQKNTGVTGSQMDRTYSEVNLMSREDRKEIPDAVIKPVAYYVNQDEKPYLRTFGDTSRLSAEAEVSRSQAAFWIVSNAGEESRRSSGAAFSPPPVKAAVEVSGPEPESPAAGQTASDAQGHKFAAAIGKLTAKVKLEADGKFRPDEPITRSEFIRWMSAYDDKGVIPFRPSTPTYTDLAPESEDYELVEGLTQSGIIAGFPDKTMRLEEKLTREQLTLLWGWYQRDSFVVKPVYAADSAKVNLRRFEDRDKIGNLFAVSVDGYVNREGKPYLTAFGDAKKLEPQAAVTRAQAAFWITEYAKGGSEG